MATFMSKSMDEVRKKIMQASLSLGNDDVNGLVSEIEEILESLKSLGLAKLERIEPMAVGVHHANRYGMGIVGAWMHSLGAKIVRMGWSNTACIGAICIEDTDDRRIESFTMDLQRGSSSFGKSPAGKIKYGSLSCGHTNQFLVAVLCGVESEHDEICIHGRLHKGRIIEIAPSMAEPLEKGLNWLVLKKEVGELFPTLPALIQSARQAIGQVQHGESHFELLQGIQTEISNAKDPTKIDWERIHKSLARSESTYAKDLPVLCEYSSCQIGWRMKKSEIYIPFF